MDGALYVPLVKEDLRFKNEQVRDDGCKEVGS